MKMESEEDKITNVNKPPWYWAVTDAGRALLELGSYLPYKALKKIDDDGDGHPVLILPGFMASDVSTLPLRSFIYNLGYTVYGWGEGRNYASEEYIDLLLEKMDTIYQRHGKKISIIGWSLGGIYARQLAKAHPEKVKQVITLGSPFKGVITSNNAKWFFDLLSKYRGSQTINQELLDDIPLPAPVPTTAIYSKEDGIVPWELCMEQHENQIHQNIQVRGSHLGLGVNPTVLQIIEDRLKQDEDEWAHFKPGSVIEDLFFYPSIEAV